MENGPAGDESTTGGHLPGTNERKRLRKYFANKISRGEMAVTKEEFLQYILDVGALLRKQDIVASAGTLADVLYDQRGFQGPEEILNMTQQDIEDAQ